MKYQKRQKNTVNEVIQLVIDDSEIFDVSFDNIENLYVGSGFTVTHVGEENISLTEYYFLSLKIIQ